VTTRREVFRYAGLDVGVCSGRIRVRSDGNAAAGLKEGPVPNEARADRKKMHDNSGKRLAGRREAADEGCEKGLRQPDCRGPDPKTAQTILGLARALPMLRVSALTPMITSRAHLLHNNV